MRICRSCAIVSATYPGFGVLGQVDSGREWSPHLFQRLLVMFDGLVPSSLGEESIGQAVVGFGIARLNGKGILELPDRLGRPPLGGKQGTLIIVKFCVGRIEFNGFLVILDISEIVVRFGIFGS